MRCESLQKCMLSTTVLHIMDKYLAITMQQFQVLWPGLNCHGNSQRSVFLSAIIFIRNDQKGKYLI